MRKFLQKNKHSIIVKLGVALLSLAASLLILEGGLRLTGYALTASRDRKFIPPYDEIEIDPDEVFERYKPGSRRRHLILAFGDSLTNGGNVKSYHSFPYQLFARFSEAGSPTAVYNLGKCEESTFGVADKFRNYLKSAPDDQLPDIAIILVGAADLFNLPLVRERRMDDGGFWLDVLPRGWIYSLRLYKVYRHIKSHFLLSRGIHTGKDVKSAEEKFKILSTAYREHKKNMRGDAHARLSSELIDKLSPDFLAEARLYNLDIRVAGDFMELLTDYAGRVYTTQTRYDDFFELLLDIAQTFPADFWTNAFDAANYHFVQTYQVQSKFTAEEVLAALDKSIGDHPELKDNEGFRNFHKLLTDREEMNRFVDLKRLETWKEIVELGRERNVRIVLQNYPVEYKDANRILAEIALKYDLPLVDNRKIFSGLISREGREKYLEDNDHLTPLGNEVMAKNVYRTLMGAGD